MYIPFKITTLVIRYKYHRVYGLVPPVQIIYNLLTIPVQGTKLPKNMRQRMADLLQLELVKRKLL